MALIFCYIIVVKKLQNPIVLYVRWHHMLIVKINVYISLSFADL